MNAATQEINLLFAEIEGRLVRLEEQHLEWLKAYMAFEPDAIKSDDTHHYGYGFGECEE